MTFLPWISSPLPRPVLWSHFNAQGRQMLLLPLLSSSDGFCLGLKSCSKSISKKVEEQKQPLNSTQ